MGGASEGVGGGEIEVVVNYDDPNEPPKVFNVRIEHAPGASSGKRYLGGYRSRRTGLEYHHASSQTRALPVAREGPEKFTREAQTQEQVTRSVQLTREGGNQMARKDLTYILMNRETLSSCRDPISQRRCTRTCGCARR